jgi:hypothetical protein
MATAVAEGTLTATVGTEHVVWEDTAANGTYQLVVDMSNLVNGERVELRIYRRVLSTDTTPLVYLARGYMRDASEPVLVSTPVLTTRHLRFTLRQLNGTGRSFKWVVEKA